MRPLDEYTEIDVRPGVRQTLKRVADSRLLQAILSNTATSNSETVQRLLRRLGVDEYFSLVYATQSELESAKPQKPDSVVFNEVLIRLDIRKDEAVMVGNNWDADILGAHRAGIHAIWLTDSSVSVRKDITSQVTLPPWIFPVRDVNKVPQILTILNEMVDTWGEASRKKDGHRTDC